MTPIGKPEPPHRDAETLLASLAGVLSAHVVREAGGRITEIHILATAGLHPKQVVRNVESALSAGLGIEIDRRVVSVAQVRTAESIADGNGSLAESGSGAPAPEPADRDPADPVQDRDVPRRLEFVRYRSQRLNDRCTCEVVLRDLEDGVEVVGHGTGGDSAGGRAEAAARAVLNGIQAARPELRLELDGASLSSSRGRSFVIVAAHVLLERETVRLAGAAPLTRSPEEAAILAALQATNRWSS
jgi:hypothetical protein